MTTGMFIGGLMILTVAAVVIVAMTSPHSSENKFLDRLKPSKKTGVDDRPRLGN